jgi:hypothetical protein
MVGLTWIYELEVLTRLAICEYLAFHKPQYQMTRDHGKELWSARFPSEVPFALNTKLVTPSANGKGVDGRQDCARLVEQRLFEKIYSGEIHLGDGEMTFPDPAMDYERQREYFARMRVRDKQRLEMDEGRSLEEINRRLDRPDDVPPPHAKSLPLGGQRWTARSSRLENDTGYESEDQLPPGAMFLADSGDKVTSRPRLRLSGMRRADEAGFSGSGTGRRVDTSMFRVDRTGSSPAWRQRAGPTEPQLLPSGEHRFVSPPPFLDSPHRLEAPAEAVAVKEEPKNDDAIVIVDERKADGGELEDGEIV